MANGAKPIKKHFTMEDYKKLELATNLVINRIINYITRLDRMILYLKNGQTKKVALKLLRKEKKMQI